MLGRWWTFKCAICRAHALVKKSLCKQILVEWESRLKINYLIFDTVTGERLTRGLSVQVAVAIAEREMQFVTPDIFQDAVRKAIQ